MIISLVICLSVRPYVHMEKHGFTGQTLNEIWHVTVFRISGQKNNGYT